MKLPPPNTKPIEDVTRSAGLGTECGRFLRAQIGNEAVFLLLKTGSRVDVGTWFFKRRVWVCLLGKELVLFASGKRPYIERVPFERLHSSRYNHVTGEVMLAPIEGLRVARLKTPPLEGLQLLAHIFRGEDEHGLA